MSAGATSREADGPTLLAAPRAAALAHPAVWLAAAAIVLTVSATAARMTPAIGFDAAPGLLASEQRLAGRGNRLTELVVANPADLAADVTMPITWWAPGQQQIVYLLRSLNVSLAAAIKTVALSMWVAGLIGWSYLFARALGNTWMLPWVVGAFALFRTSHASAFEYTGGDTLLWGVFPLVVIVNLVAAASSRRGGLLVVVAAGVLTSGLIVLKYSAVLLAAGIAVWWAWETLRRSARLGQWCLWLTGAMLGLWLVAAAGVFDLVAGPTPASALKAHSMPVVTAAQLFGPLAALSDAAEAGTTVARRLGGGPLQDGSIALLATALGLLCIAWAALVSRPSLAQPASPPARLLRLAVSVSVAVSAGLFLLLWRGGDISLEARHHQYGALLLLPFLAQMFVGAARATRGMARLLSAVCVAVFLVLPALYGAGVLARRAVVGATGVQREWSREGPGASPVLGQLAGVESLNGALLATISPRTALGFPGHRILFVMNSGPATGPWAADDYWRTERFAGRPAGSVALLLPPGVTTADTDTLLHAFDDVQTWTVVPLNRVPAAQLWIGR